MYLPQSAADLLKDRNLTPGQSAYLEAHTVPNPAAASDSPTPDPVQTAESAPEAAATNSAATTETSTKKLVKGKASFQEVLGWGVSQETIKTAIQAEVDKANQ